jgi:multimeric flavodoxin WrbA
MATGKGKTVRVKALGIVGSPRRGGNTDVLVSEVLLGAAEAGASTSKKQLSSLEIGGCRGCGACIPKGRCVQEDGMASLLGPMEKSRVWVLGTPVYWWGPTAQFKAFVDRWFGAVRRFSFKGKKIVLVVPLGDTDPVTARHTVGMLSDALCYVGAIVVDTVLGLGLGDKGAARKNPAILKRARQAGAKAVKAAGSA